jgi:hypothetical protein
VILVNTERAGHVVNPRTPIIPEPSVPDCQEETKQAKEECQNACDASCDSQKEEIHHQCTNEMNNLKAELDHSCQDRIKAEINTCQTHADDQCTSEKSLLEQSLQAECDKQISDLNKQLQFAKNGKQQPNHGSQKSQQRDTLSPENKGCMS